MNKLEKVLDNLENNLILVNRQVFNLRVKKRKSGLTEQERILYRQFRFQQLRIKSQIKGLKEKLGVE